MAEPANGNDGGDQGRTSSLGFDDFSEDRLRIDRIVERLDVTTDATERADLGGELVRAVSRYEDTFERVFRNRLEESFPAVVPELDRDLDALRAALDDVHQRTMGIDPRNVHASDGQGFEDTLAEVVRIVRELAVAEDGAIGDIVASMTPEERQELAEEVTHAHRHASERPRPPRTAVGRLVSNAHIKLDRTLEDVSTPRHPGADTAKG